MKFFVSFLLCVIHLHSAAQKQYQFPEKFNPVYDFKPAEAEKQLLSTKTKSDKENELLKRYIALFIYGEQNGFDANKVYMDWPDVENYFSKVLNTVFPANLDKRNLGIYIQREPEANAFATRFGNIYFNIGMVCEAENEAFLAHVIAHETGHYYLKHMIKELKMQEEVVETRRTDLYVDYRKLNRKLEIQADSFAADAMKKAHYNLSSSLDYFESQDMKERIYRYSVSYNNMLRASALSSNDLKKKKESKVREFDSHPSTIERFASVKNKIKPDTITPKNFLVDSLFFTKLKKIAKEERKKIYFENCDFDYCLRYSFVDYLYEPKNLKNLYYIIESLRRTIYAKPELAETGFLTENIYNENLFKYNKSILHLPDYIFSNYKEYSELKDHLLFKLKPFNTYSEALLYFSKEAINLKLNEANFSLGLYYLSLKKQDSCKKYLSNYVAAGSGLYYDYAQVLLKKNKPFVEEGKTFILYNNTGNYTEFNFNYLFCQKKKTQNPDILKELVIDTNKTKLLLLNELFGQSPRKLYQFQKLIQSITSLYNEDDVEMCKKVRVNSHFANETADISNKFKKHLLIYAPEWYTFYKENGYSKLFYLDMVYQYRGFTKEEEYYNNYTGYYLDANLDRPYFKDAVRNGSVRKKSESETRKEIIFFLYE